MIFYRPKYDARMVPSAGEKKHTALYLSPWMFPPKPARFFSIVDILAACGFTMLILDWGYLFPWAVDERFFADDGMPEEAVAALYKRAHLRSLELVPSIPIVGDMSCFLSIPTYSYLSTSVHNRMSLDLSAPGSQKFVCDLVDDTLELLPDTCLIHIELLSESPTDNTMAGDSLLREMEHRNLGMIVPRINRADDFFELSCANGVSIELLDPAGPPHHYGTMWRLRDIVGWSEQLPPSIELYIDLLPAKPDGLSREATDFAQKLRCSAARFERILDICWREVRRTRELLSTACFSPPQRLRALGPAEGAIAELNRLMDELKAEKIVLQDGFAGIVSASTTDTWFHGRIEALAEEKSLLTSRIRQFGIKGAVS